MKHYLSIADLSPDELSELIQLALQLKAEWKAGGNKPILQGKSLAMLFMKPSLRTRVSFEMAMVHLGGYALYLAPQEIKMGQRESVPDVARVLSGYVDGIMARVFEHDHIVQLAEYASVPVINGLSDYGHPAQALADVLTIVEAKGSLEGLNITYVGDSNNVTRSLLFAAVKLGANFRIASPAGYHLTEEDHELAESMNHKGVAIEAFEDPDAAVEGADVIYTDVWTSMGQEAETAERLKVFPPYQLNSKLIGRAKADAIVMHCLPAHRGEEITDEVADSPQSVVFPQAHNRMHAQKAILAKLLGGA
ncbi:MAG: ornithine carbamoyltransferase [Anaerolineales bacterium]|nr:ornithine carbamoyltransferase [Anaerolineales bacterium]MCB0014111.1 ornithine carbamoyltransferase [Anaerolineales bacterium]MCB0017439.1 ornithine carbamoyltransferase [Anaerolineales bacterium]MCB8959840.1 ornithine carbamoyltransferase [Ardenticatenales bacterium]